MAGHGEAAGFIYLLLLAARWTCRLKTDLQKRCFVLHPHMLHGPCPVCGRVYDDGGKNCPTFCRSSRVWFEMSLIWRPRKAPRTADRRSRAFLSLRHSRSGAEKQTPCDEPYCPKVHVMSIQNDHAPCSRKLHSAIQSLMQCMPSKSWQPAYIFLGQKVQPHSTEKPISSSTTPARPFDWRCVPELTGGQVFCRTRSFSASRSACGRSLWTRQHLW